MADTCPTCGGPRQSFYVAGYEKGAARVAELEAALEEVRERIQSLPGCEVSHTVLWALSNTVEDIGSVLADRVEMKGQRAAIPTEAPLLDERPVPADETCRIEAEDG